MEGLDGSPTKRTESESSAISESDTESVRTFLEKEALGHLTHLFSEQLSLGYLRSLTDDELEHDFGVKDGQDREQLVRSILKLRDEYSDDEHEVR